MSAPNPLSAFYAALDENPADHVTLLALADWYEEQDQSPAAECLRWLASHGYRPFLYRVNGGLTVSSEVWHDGWFWWAVDEPYHARDWGHPPNCRLPRLVWLKLRHTFNYEPAVFKEYSSRQAAYEALIDIWPLIGSLDQLSAVREKST
jgi:uncharacterized protein (TIGR02996 family)